MQFTDYLLKKALFRPVKLALDYEFQFEASFEELWLDTLDGQRLHALSFPAAKRAARGVVLYFHGNRDNLQRWGAKHAIFTEMGYDFVAPDYRGYGKSSGEPDEQRFFEDAHLFYQRLLERYPAEQIVLYGRSLGSGIASWLAARFPAKMMILETPFDNIKGLISSHLRQDDLTFEPTLRFPNDEHLAKATMPVLIFHGARDRVVPYASAARLKAGLKPGDLFVTIEGGSHNNLEEFKHYHTILREWLER